MAKQWENTSQDFFWKIDWFWYAYYIFISPSEGTGISDIAKPFRMLLERQVHISFGASLKEKLTVFWTTKKCVAHI